MQQQASTTMLCNLCWLPLERSQRHACTPCLHLYCLDCTSKLLEMPGAACNVCSTPLTRQSVKAVQVLQDVPKYKFALCGQTPDVIMQTALTAINFYCQQNDLSSQYRENKMQNKMQNLHVQCTAKLQQVHLAYQKAKGKVSALTAQKAALEQENNEISSKYQQRASQVAQLKEQIQALSGGHIPSTKNRPSMNQLAMQSPTISPRSMGLGLDPLGGMDPMSNSGGGLRGSHPMGDLQMMTTTRQRQHIFNMSADPELIQQNNNSGGNNSGSKKRRRSMPSDTELLEMNGISPCKALGIGSALPAGLPRQSNWGIGSPRGMTNSM